MTRAKWSGAVADPVFCLTVDGSLRAEWLAKPWDVSLEIDLPSKTGYFHSLNLATDEDSEIEGLDLATVEAWNQIETAIRETVGKVAHD